MPELTKPTVLYQVTEEALATVRHKDVRNAEELTTMILDIQENDKLTTDEAIAHLVVLGAVTRKRSIDYARETKAAKDAAIQREKYNKWVLQNPAQAADPKVNLTFMLAHGLIDRATYNAMVAATEAAQKPAEQTAPKPAAK